ncbi:MAG: MCE family protein [Cyclobacteriaceae bacterium]|nr:MCE family protein [Cyclobacteriaceae bacterium]
MTISKEVKVGVFAVMALTVLYLGFNYLKGVDFFASTKTYYVMYDDVGGLTRSNPVNINGFTVGRVAKIKLLQNRKNKILVEMDIDSDIILGDTAMAKLNSDLLGSVSIIIFPGDISNPIKPGDTLRAKVDPDLTELLKESAQPLSDNLQVTIRKLNVLLEDMNGSGEKLKAALESFTKLSDNVNARIYENRGNLKEIVTEFKLLSQNLNKTVKDLQPTLQNFQTVSDSLRNLELNATLHRVDTLLYHLTLVTQKFENDSGTFGKLMNDDELYVSLNKTIADLDSLLNHLNDNPKHFFAPLGKSKKKIEKEKAREAN